jgi:poly-beta-hydroxyalkanoate depolymerase
MVNELFITTLNSKKHMDSHENLQVSTKQRDGEKQDTTVNIFLARITKPKGPGCLKNGG